MIKGLPVNKRFPPTGASYHFVSIPISSITDNVSEPGPHLKKKGSDGFGGSGSGSRTTVTEPDTDPIGQLAFETERSVYAPGVLVVI